MLLHTISTLVTIAIHLLLCFVFDSRAIDLNLPPTKHYLQSSVRQINCTRMCCTFFIQFNWKSDNGTNSVDYRLIRFQLTLTGKICGLVNYSHPQQMLVKARQWTAVSCLRSLSSSLASVRRYQLVCVGNKECNDEKLSSVCHVARLWQHQ